jgi:hypothetical protein
LTWSFGKFKKTFPTPLSGFPELLFDEGFTALKSFCMEISSYSTTSLESTANNATAIPFNDDEIHNFTPDDEDNIKILFMANETIHLKVGKGIIVKSRTLAQSLLTVH